MKSKSNSVKDRVKFHSYETFRAKVFFKVLETKDYQLMKPKPGVKGEDLQKLFDAVHDEYFLKVDDNDANEYLKLTNSIQLYEYKILCIRRILAYVYTIPANISDHPEIVKIVREQLEELNKHLEEPINFEEDSLVEFTRVLNVEVGILKDEVEIALQGIDQLKKGESQAVFNYDQQVFALEQANDKTYDAEEMMLPTYVERLKGAIAKTRAQKQQQLAKK